MPNNKGIGDASLLWGTLSMPRAEKCSAQHNQGAGARPETAMQATWGSGAGGTGWFRAALRVSGHWAAGERQSGQGKGLSSRHAHGWAEGGGRYSGWRGASAQQASGGAAGAPSSGVSGREGWWTGTCESHTNPEFSSSQDDKEHASKCASQGH